MDNLITILVAIPILALSIGTHEMTHALVSNALGDDTAKLMGRVSINPLKHIDLFTTVLLPLVLLLMGLPPIGAAKPVPFNPNRIKYEEFGVAMVAASGPLTNLLLAVLFGLVLHITGGVGIVSDIAIIGLYVNIGFFVFNMIPFPPLDGSRILYAFAPTPLQRVMEAIEGFGWMSILFFVFVVFPFVQPAIGHLNELILNFFK